jgi:hypothetical protein
MMCPFCNTDIKTRSKAWQGFYCKDCQTTLYTQTTVEPDVFSADSPTQIGVEVLYSITFSVHYKGKGYQIDYSVDSNVTNISPFITINDSGIPTTPKAIKLPGLVITPQNAQTRLPTILVFS